MPCGTSREAVRRSKLAGLAGYGHCASHSRWYWGLKLYLLTTAEGMPVAWCLANPKLGEREVAQELFGHARDRAALRDGMIIPTDKGLSGKQMEHFARRPGRGAAGPSGPQRREAPLRQPGGHAAMGRVSQRHPQGQLDLERHGGRTSAGVYARVAQRILAMAAAIWHNWATNAPIRSSLIAYDH